MTTFSFRAECPADVETFKRGLAAVGIPVSMELHRTEGFPDVKVEMKVDARIEQLHDILRNIPDTHVILQTLRPVPLAENSLKRDHTIW